MKTDRKPIGKENADENEELAGGGYRDGSGSGFGRLRRKRKGRERA